MSEKAYFYYYIIRVSKEDLIMTDEEVLIAYFGGKPQYSGGKLYKIGDMRVEYSGGKLYKVGGARIEYSGGKLYRVNGERVEWSGGEVKKIGNRRIK